MADSIDKNLIMKSKNSNKFKENDINLQSQQSQDLVNENRLLRNSIKQLQLKINNNNKDEFQELFEQNQQLQQYIQQIEEEYESLQLSNKQLQKALKKKVATDLQDNQDMIQKLDKIQDPNSIILINQLLQNIKLNERNENQSLNDSQMIQKTQQRLHKNLDKMELRIQKLQFENKTLKKELTTFQQQNEFMQNQLNFAERKLKNLTGQENQDDYDILQDVCEVFGISDPNDLLDNAFKIKQVYEIVPELQQTLEEVYKIVTEESCFPVMCNSNEQLLEILQNWSQNLQDYQSLVDQLFNILQINDESFKNRTYLLSQIKELASFNSNQQESDKENNNNKIFSQIEQLKQSQTSYQFFCDEAKKKLNLQNYSNEALFNKILILIDEKIKKDLSKNI